MKQLKKTILTLVALIAVTTGAWADGTCGDGVTWSLSGGKLTIGYSGTGTGEMTDFERFDDNYAESIAPWSSSASSITSVVVEDGVINVGEYAFYKFTALTSVTFPASLKYIGQGAFQGCTSLTEFTFPASVNRVQASVLAGCTNLTEVTVLSTDMDYIFVWAFDGCSSLKTINIYDETPCNRGDNAFAGIANLEHIYVPAGSVDAYKNATIWSDVASKIAAMPAQGTPVDIVWDAATKTATFTQPAGNVKVSVEYYPFALLSDNGVTANTEAAATTDAQLVLVGDGAATGGTLMYYVTNDANFTKAQAIALIDEDPTAWSADVPTAEGLNPEGATYYVWYYIKGDAEHSDTDPDRVTVTVLPEPTYKVEFAEGTNEDPNKWTVDPEAAYGENAAGVKKGTKVTITYDGPRKVIGVKAEKKKAGPKTYTELNGGEVLHVGDILNFSDANVTYSFGGYNLKTVNCPFTVLRANITGAQFNPTVTPADDGEYYVMQAKGGDYYFAGKNLPATATSDGLLITINSVDGNIRYGTISVHEPNP